MKTLSIRDIIGPIMIGPSSSHTAGALRIALMARELLSCPPVDVEFVLYGSFAHTYHGHGTDRALVGGMLGFQPDDPRIRESFALAEAQGLSYRFTPDPDTPTEHPNTVDVRITDEQGQLTVVRGESIGGGAARIRALNGVEVLLTGEYHSIVVKQRDARGVLAHIAAALSNWNVNIATTRLFRKRKGDIAYTIMETDEKIAPEVVRAVEAHPDVISVSVIQSDRASEAHAPQAADSTALGGEMQVRLAALLSAEEPEDLLAHYDFTCAEELLALCDAEHLAISEAICCREQCLLATFGFALDDTKNYLREVLQVMRSSATTPIEQPRPSMGGIIGGEARKLALAAGMVAPLSEDDAQEHDAGAEAGRAQHVGAAGGSPISFSAPARLLDSPFSRATTYAMAVLETNASMGCIVAAPTAGSSGVLPAVLLACQDVYGFSDDQLERALANAAAIGYLIARNATVSGAEGGCQAEVGAASAMAASALCELFGGSPRQCLAAASNALVGLMGLVCDPIAGLVESPCQKRNATGAANALVSAQIALAGIDNMVSFDETVAAMYAVGHALPFELRESALGGLAATPSACAFCQACAEGSRDTEQPR